MSLCYLDWKIATGQFGELWTFLSRQISIACVLPTTEPFPFANFSYIQQGAEVSLLLVIH